MNSKKQTKWQRPTRLRPRAEGTTDDERSKTLNLPTYAEVSPKQRKLQGCGASISCIRHTLPPFLRQVTGLERSRLKRSEEAVGKLLSLAGEVLRAGRGGRYVHPDQSRGDVGVVGLAQVG